MQGDLISKNQEVFKLLQKNVKLKLYDFKVYITEEKYILGLSQNTIINDDSILKLISLSTELLPHYETIKQLNTEVSFSFDYCISLSDEINKKSISSNSTLDLKDMESFKYVYFLNDAIFRIITLSDNLAQMYNIIYECEFHEKEVSCYNFFEKNTKNKEFGKEAANIVRYLNGHMDLNLESLGIYDEDLDKYINKEVHKFVRKYRNDIIHGHSSYVSNYAYTDGIYIPDHPIIVLAKSLLDWNMCIRFLNEVLDTAYKKMKTINK